MQTFYLGNAEEFTRVRRTLFASFSSFDCAIESLQLSIGLLRNRRGSKESPKKTPYLRILFAAVFCKAFSFHFYKSFSFKFSTML